MSKETSESVKREVVRLYFLGRSYDEIKDKLGIGKATVFEIIQELRSGEGPSYENLGDLITDMRSLAVGLRKVAIAPAEAVGLFTLSKRLWELAEPAQLEHWVNMCRSVPKGEKYASSKVVQAAVRLTGLETDHGLSYDDAISKYESATRELAELGEKAEATRTALGLLEEHQSTLTQACRELEAERARLEVANADQRKQVEKLSTHCKSLEKRVTELQTAIPDLEAKDTSLRESVANLEKQLAAQEAETAERAATLQALSDLGFSREQLDQLRISVVEMEVRYGRQELYGRFVDNLANYDSCLGLESTRHSIQNDIAELSAQRDSLIAFAEKLGLEPEEVGSGVAALKVLQKKGVPPDALVSYHRLLEESAATPRAFEKMIADLGGLQKSISARQDELESIKTQIITEKKMLDELEASKKGTEIYLEFLKESTAKEIQKLTVSAKDDVNKFCQELHHDIDQWGSVRGELSKCERELKLARYFGSIPLSEQAVKSLVHDMDIGIIVQYLLLVRAWSLMKSNPKGKLPESMRIRYPGIQDYTKLELADLATWSLTLLTGGN